MTTPRRLRFRAASASMGGLLIGAALAPAAYANDAQDCVNNFVSAGRAVVAGPVYEIPYRSVGGAPYIENEITSKPGTYSFASNAYEGWVGDIVLGTSGFYPRNPTSAAAHYPPVADPQGGPGPTKVQYSQGPLGRTAAEAKPNESAAEAQAFGDSAASGGLLGPSTARTHTVYDGKAVKGVDQVIGYDVHVGPVVVRQMRSTVTYESDGTSAGTKANWNLEFSGLGDDDDDIYRITAEGVASQDAQPQPGAAGMKQFNEGAKTFADALEVAGVTRPDLKVAPGVLEIRGPGELYVQTAALELRNAVVGAQNTTAHAQGMVFGWHERRVKVVRGSCEVDYNQVQFDEYEETDDSTAKNLGPIRYPDPSSSPEGETASADPAPRPVPGHGGGRPWRAPIARTRS